jgi:hypothetical protein
VPDKLRISAAYLVRANFFSDMGVLTGTALALIPIDPLLAFIRGLRAKPARSAELFLSEQVEGVEDERSPGFAEGRDYDGATSLL